MDNESKDNIYASNVKDEIVYIKNVISGKKGYFCLGCKREMQAVKSKLVDRKSFFRHDATAMKGQPKCTYSDETYRHKLAKTILQETKRIKVPSLYKYPPNGVEGKANLISKSRYIQASRVAVELTFYEDENGLIHYGKNIKSKEKHLLIRPDVTFFNAQEEPILFIELVASHKVTDEKKNKIKRLGIDTVQVNIPKSSPEEIEEVFQITKHTKWIYNNEESNAIYISVSESDRERISSSDEIQRELFRESYNCKSSQINELIRSIKRCLRSELYCGVESGLRSDISRVEGIRKEREKRLQGVQDELENEIVGECEGWFRKQNASEIARIRDEEKKLEEEEKRFSSEQEDLERRYKEKRGEIEGDLREQREINRGKRSEYENFETVIGNKKRGLKTILEEQKKWDERAAEFEQSNSELRDSIEILKLEEENLPETFEFLEREAIRSIDDNKDREKQEIEQLERDEIEIEEGFRNDKEYQRENLEGRKSELRKEITSRFDTILREVKEGKVGKHGSLSRDIQNFFKSISLLDDISEVRSTFKRHEIALETLRKRTFINEFEQRDLF